MAGTWNGKTDAAPIRQILADHADAGWTPAQIAYVTDLTYTYTRTLLGLGLEPAPREVRAATARAVISLIGADRLDPRVPDEAFIDPTGSVRRLQALRALRWPVQVLEARYNRSLRPPDDTRVAAGYARYIRSVYEELSATPGPSARVASLAVRRGWAPPLAWEDVDIDDPRAEPLPWRGRTQRSADELVEDAEFIIRTTNANLNAAAARLGVHRNTLDKARERVAARAKAGAA